MEVIILKKTTMIFFVLIFVVALFGNYSFMNPLGPTLVPVYYLSEYNDDVDVSYWKSLDQVIAEVTDDLDAILLPVSTGEKLNESGYRIKLAAVSMWNGFYFVSKNESINELTDFQGKDVYTLSGAGQTGDVILKGAMKILGLEPGKDFNIQYVSGPESVQMLAAGKADVILVPEPFASLSLSKVEGARKILSLKEVWNKYWENDFNIPTSGIFVSEDLSQDEVKEVLSFYKESMEKSLDNVNNTANFVSEKMNGFPIPVLIKAIEGIDFIYQEVPDINEEVIFFFDELQEVYPELVGNINYENLFYKK